MANHIPELYLLAKNNIAIFDIQYGVSITPQHFIKVTVDGAAWITSAHPAHNVWTEIVVLIKAGEYKKIYMDKIFIDQTTQGAIAPTNHPLRIGTRGGAGQQPVDCFNGRLDEVAIYSRILTPEEI